MKKFLTLVAMLTVFALMNVASAAAALKAAEQLVFPARLRQPQSTHYDARKIFVTFAAVMVFALMNVASAAQITSDGYFNGIRLWGKVRVVTSFPDIKVQVVDAFPDLKVQRVSSFPDALGKWQFVTSGEDFTIQYVDAFPDIKIKFVSAFPGL